MLSKPVQLNRITKGGLRVSPVAGQFLIFWQNIAILAPFELHFARF